jgi:uncharacterized membrane protein (UPF0136 family)
VSGGTHLAAAVISVGGLVLAGWLRDRSEIRASVLVFIGVVAGMAGLGQSQGSDWASLCLWFVGGVVVSGAASVVRFLVLRNRRDAPSGSRP